MTDKIDNALFLCTGNSARSIFAEALLRHWDGARFRALSAGSFPKGVVHPLTTELLRAVRLPTEGLRSKSWAAFAGPQAPAMDFVFTVCDQAAGEICPVRPGNPVTAHRGASDPVAVEGTEVERRQAFCQARRVLEAQIKLFVALPLDKLDRLSIRRRAEEIGRSPAILAGRALAEDMR